MPNTFEKLQLIFFFYFYQRKDVVEGEEDKKLCKSRLELEALVMLDQGSNADDVAWILTL